MTIAQKSKETRVDMKDGNGINLCSYIQPKSLHIRQVASDNSAYVRIIGCIYRTKIDPISILHIYPCFLTFLSNGHPYIFSEIFFPLLVPGLFLLFYGFMYKVHSVFAGTDERIVFK